MIMKKIEINETLGASILLAVAVILIIVFSPTREKSTEENFTSTTFTPIEIIWTGKIHGVMTYGRLLFKNLDPDAEYKYFIAEPDDVISDGGRRYSPTTGNIQYTDIVRVTGVIEHEELKCWWDELEYGGCVPWVSIDKIQVVN